ncbi:MAG: hypothetical protein M1830_007593, partial [Pleopsidium flavum]
MAPSRSKAPTNLGSTQWILSEREQVQHIADLDAEEFAFSVRNEVDWLNEHMAEIFDENQLNIAEIFKTPGKLRGKTPRTARKRNILEIRAPLTDVFSANQRVGQSPSHQTQFYKQVAHFQVAEDPVLKVPNEEMDAEKPPQVGKGNTDSGYHGMSEDEMDVDPTIGKPERLATIESSSPRVAPSDGHKDVQMSVERSSQGQRTTEGSFHSAKEPHPAQIASKPNSQEDIDMERNEDDEALSIPLQTSPKGDQSMHLSQPKFALPLEASPITSAEVPPPEKDLVLEDVQTIDDMRSPSEGSSPVRALVRKSSLTFASLPAREPLATKMSIGARNSRTSHLDQSKMAATNRGSYFGRHTDGKSLGDLRKPQPAEEAVGGEEMDVDEEGIHPNQSTNEKPIADTTMTVLHNKSSTQRLHDKINMLGQSQPSRPTKSIPSIAAVTAHLNYHDLPRIGSEQLVDASKGPGFSRQALGPDMQIFTDDDEDDWIQPPPQMKNGKRPQVTKRLSTEVIEEVVVKHSISGKEVKPSVASSTMAGSRQASPLRHAAVPTRPMNSAVPAKSASTSVIGSTSKVATTPGGGHKDSLSASNPGVANVQGEASITTTTPAGTPKLKHNVEGPLSASKAKLQSIMKGARGLFTSSAGISAQAKMETMSPPYIRTAAQAHMSSMDEILGGGKMSEDAFRILDRDVNTVRDALAEAPADPSSPPNKAEGRKTRSSTEREEKRKDKEAKERQRAEEEVSTARGKEKHKVATQTENKVSVATHEKVMIKQAGNNVAKGSQSQKQIRQSPRHIQKSEELVVEPLETDAVSLDVEMMDCPQAMAPPPSRDQTQTSQMQKPKDIRRPIKPAREAAPKPKPQPVAIRV